MIVRRWSGWVPRKHAAGFQTHLLHTGIADYAKQPGCTDIKLLSCDERGGVRFVLFSTWRSTEHIRRYCGADLSGVVLYPGDENFELEPELTAQHFELVDIAQEAHGVTHVTGNCDDLTQPVGPFSHSVSGSGLIFLP